MQAQSNPFQTFCMRILAQPKFSWAVTIALSCFDMTAWLSLALISLIILRHGVKAAWNLMCANFVVHGLSLYWFHPDAMSWINAALDFWPGFLGAVILFNTRSWYWTTCSMLGFMVVIVLGMDIYAPDYSALQLKGFLASAQNLASQMALPMQVVQQLVQEHSRFCAHLLIGLQILSVMINAVIGLTMARSLQSQLFYPQGFQLEMMSLRGCRWLLLLMLLSVLLIYHMNCLFPLYFVPTLVFYFFGVGLSIGVSTLSKNRTQIVFFVLTAASVLLPYVFIPMYVIVGALDSFVNFRLLLARRVKYTF